MVAVAHLKLHGRRQTRADYREAAQDFFVTLSRRPKPWQRELR
jgi:hypothetical protein